MSLKLCTQSPQISVPKKTANAGKDKCDPATPQRIPGPPEILVKSRLIAVLSTVSQTQNLPRYVTVDRWVKTRWYTWSMEFYSSVEENEIMPLVG